MTRNLIVLPDGTELFSGIGDENAIQSVTVTQSVNSGNELTLGSACSSMLEAALIAPRGSLNIAAGAEITLYRVDDSGERYKVGLFTMEKPERASANVYRITAYDRVSWLDKDLTDWLAALEGWPYRLGDFAAMVCEACGLTLVSAVSADFPNKDYEIQQFVGSGITGRQLMQWAGEACARFCRANADGEIEFAWYAESDKHILPTGDLYYYGGSLSYEDYITETIGQVKIQMTEDDIGVAYPQTESATNVYAITGNYLLTTTSAETLLPVAQNIYDAICGVGYTPCSVKIPSDAGIDAGDIVNITDINGSTITTYIMTKVQSGQTDTLESTGSVRRDSSTAVHNTTMGALNSRMLEIRKSIEGLNVKATDLKTVVEDGMKSTSQQVADLNVRADGVSSEVFLHAEQLGKIEEKMTAVEQTAESVAIRVQKIEEDGVDKVVTSMGYTFDDTGLHIQKEGEEMDNTLDHTGMYVRRGDEVMLQANASGVQATDVTVRNYLIVGSHARFEDYNDGTDDKRTACFWI